MKQMCILNKVKLTLFVMLVALISGCQDSGGQAMFRGNLERTGVFSSGGPSSLHEIVWKFKTEAAVLSSPAISGGMVYFGSFDDHLYAVDIKTGQEKWKFKTEDAVWSSPAISGGMVYFGSDDGHLYAVDIKTGQKMWKFKTEKDVKSSPAISGGMVYFGSDDGHLYAVDIKIGQEKWKFKTEG